MVILKVNLGTPVNLGVNHEFSLTCRSQNAEDTVGSVILIKKQIMGLSNHSVRNNSLTIK